jgi:hypothetical protein
MQLHWPQNPGSSLWLVRPAQRLLTLCFLTNTALHGLAWKTKILSREEALVSESPLVAVGTHQDWEVNTVCAVYKEESLPLGFPAPVCPTLLFTFPFLKSFLVPNSFGHQLPIGVFLTGRKLDCVEVDRPI